LNVENRTAAAATALAALYQIADFLQSGVRRESASVGSCVDRRFASPRETGANRRRYGFGFFNAPRFVLIYGN
jgi:hypothetical protein